MTKNNKEVLGNIISGVFERFAFMFTESEDPEILDNQCSEFFHASITFTGPCEGTITLTTPRELCKELAVNVLGEEIEESDSLLAQDALKEVLNIICGELTVALCGQSATFDLTVPSICSIHKDRWIELSLETDVIKIYIEETPVLAGLLIAE